MIFNKLIVSVFIIASLVSLPHSIAEQLSDNDIIQINLSKEGELSNKELTAFGDIVKDKRIVALGEQTHGAGNVFALKSQLIQYLHQYHDFDLFVLESGMYEVDRLWQLASEGESLKALASGNIFYMYAKSEEVTPLFNYINKQITSEKPLTLVGFDSQHTGALSNKNLVADLESNLAQTKSKLISLASWPIFKRKLQQVLDLSTTRFIAQEEQQFFSLLQRVQGIFKENDNGFWHRIAVGLEAQANRQWGLKDERSKEMGENIKWLAQQHPNKKILVWAHTWHLTKKGNSGINAGNVLSDHFGDEYYMVHFTGNKGSFLDFIDMKIKPVKETKSPSVENVVVNLSDADVNFFDVLTNEEKTAGLSLLVNDYNTNLPSKVWSTYFDGIFVSKKVSPATFIE